MNNSYQVHCNLYCGNRRFGRITRTVKADNPFDAIAEASRETQNDYGRDIRVTIKRVHRNPQFTTNFQPAA